MSGDPPANAPRPRPRTVAARPRRRLHALAGTAAPSAHHDEEVLEDAGREEGSKPVVGLIEPEAVQVARRGLEIVAHPQRHGLAVRPAESLAVQPEEVLEVARVKVRADAAARPTLGDDEEELTGRVRVAGEERVAAEPLASSVRETYGAGGQRQLLVRDADGRRRRRDPRCELEIACGRAPRKRRRRKFSSCTCGRLCILLRLTHGGEGGPDPMVHREQGQLCAVGMHRPGVRRTRWKIGEITAHHRPARVPELELDLPAHDEHRGVAAEMRVPWHGRPGVTGEGRELVDIARVGRPCDPFHDLTAHPVVFAGVCRQDVHALLPGQFPDERHGLSATHLDRIENFVGHAGQR